MAPADKGYDRKKSAYYKFFKDIQKAEEICSYDGCTFGLFVVYGVVPFSALLLVPCFILAGMYAKWAQVAGTLLLIVWILFMICGAVAFVLSREYKTPKFIMNYVCRFRRLFTSNVVAKAFYSKRISNSNVSLTMNRYVYDHGYRVSIMSQDAAVLLGPCPRWAQSVIKDTNLMEEVVSLMIRTDSVPSDLVDLLTELYRMPETNPSEEVEKEFIDAVSNRLSDIKEHLKDKESEMVAIRDAKYDEERRQSDVKVRESIASMSARRHDHYRNADDESIEAVGDYRRNLTSI